MEAAGKEIYTDSFYRFMKHKENSCKKAAEAIYQLLCPTSVVDIGCGTGEWLAHFKKCGASVVRGYDGSYVAKEMLAIAQEEFLPCNLSENIQVDRKYDLAVSLEVAEHLDACCADQLVANITGFSDVVLFSAAIPGQGGDGHVNEQWQSYWQAKFEGHGYVCLDCVRNLFWKIEELDPYYKQNAMLYVKKHQEALISKLQSMEKKIVSDLVHPVTYLKYKENLELMAWMLNDIGGGIWKGFLKKRVSGHWLSMAQEGLENAFITFVCRRNAAFLLHGSENGLYRW